MKKTRFIIVSTIILLLLISITFIWKSWNPPHQNLIRVKAPSVSFFKEDLDDPMILIEALDKQEKWFNRRLQSEENGANKKIWFFGKRRADSALMLASLKEFKRIYTTSRDPAILRRELANSFDFYKMAGKESKNILFTGYYTPIIEAQLQKSDKFRFPIYSLPKDLIKVNLSPFKKILSGYWITGRFDEARGAFVPYYTREEIDWGGVLSGRHLEIAYLEDYIDQFFLHIQGGGVLELPDKKRIFVNYAGKNGRSFVGVGRLLLNSKELKRENMSMQSIRMYFKKHPEKIKEYCIQNKSYVFYEKGSSGPYGSLGVVVSPGRSIATDKSLYLGGSICLISGRIPIPKLNFHQALKQKQFSRFVIDQDTGGAIVGKHIDIYCGIGPIAASQAGSLNSHGDVYMLLLKSKP